MGAKPKPNEISHIVQKPATYVVAREKETDDKCH